MSRALPATTAGQQTFLGQFPGRAGNISSNKTCIQFLHFTVGKTQLCYYQKSVGEGQTGSHTRSSQPSEPYQGHVSPPHHSSEDAWLGGLSPGPALVCETNFGLAPTLDLISLIFLSVNINWSIL